MPTRGRIENDLTGREFGAWTVQGVAGRTAGRVTLWWCLCDPARGGCGARQKVQSGRLRFGGSRRCKSCAAKARHARGDLPHVPTLQTPIWSRVCGTCDTPFVGAARQKYCRPECRPSHPSRRKGD